MTKTEAQVQRDAKRAAVEALERAGGSVRWNDTPEAVRAACEPVFGPKREFETTHAYFLRVAQAGRDLAKASGAATSREANLMIRPEWHPEPHLRADDIDALPSQVSMGWDGKMGRGYASWGNGTW